MMLIDKDDNISRNYMSSEICVARAAQPKILDADSAAP